MIILDTNVLSALMLSEPEVVVASWLDRQARTSVWTTSVTIFEIRYDLAAMPAGRRQMDRYELFERLVEEKLERRVLSFDHAAAEEAASLMGARRRAGRPVELRDTMIAGIALAQGATLATRDVRHFGDLEVPVVDPWEAKTRPRA
jgi:predicted nucleic acid-binding protein